MITRHAVSRARRTLRRESVTYVPGIVRYLCDRNDPDLNGGQGRNRTTDTRIFSPPKSAPSVTHRHLKQFSGLIRSLGECSWVLVDDAGLGTKLETDNSNRREEGFTYSRGKGHVPDVGQNRSASKGQGSHIRSIRQIHLAQKSFIING